MVISIKVNTDAIKASLDAVAAAVRTVQANWLTLRLANLFGEHFLTEECGGRVIRFCRYRGVVYFFGYVDEIDPPVVTFDQVVGWMRNALAGIGVLALAVGLWLWQAGFFQGVLR